MRKFMVWALTATLAFAPAAPAYAEEQKPRARAFYEPGTDLSTTEKLAQEIEKCATDNITSRLSCNMLVSSFNAAFADIDDVKDYRELADYVRKETEVRPCPRVVTAVAHILGDKVGTSERELREGENCFFDTNTQRFIAAGCGQWTPNLPLTRTTAASETGTSTSPTNKPLTDSATAKAAAAGRESSTDSRGSGANTNQFSQADENDRNFIDRHGKKIALGAGIVGGLALLAVLFGTRQSVEQCQIVNVGGPPIRDCR